MVITDLAQFELLVQEVRDQILSESQGVGEVDIVDNLDNIYSLPALKLNDSGDQVVEAPLSLLSAPAEEAAATANAAAQAANTAAESANSAASSANLATDKTNEAISNAQSATQQAELSADKANTAAQKADEATAQVLSGESERVEAENARQAAETERQSAEEERKSAEEARKLAEQSREEAEASRVSAEESRVTAESERVTAESSRAQAETERVLKESERESAELTRQLNETTRQSNETTRVQLEQTRLTNEEQRVSAESSRETEYADLKQRADALIDDNEAAIENANTAADNANAAIANMENTYAKKDEIPDVSEFVTTTVDNLVNYYKKSETYTKEEINSLIDSTASINFKVVDSLPETGESNIIYLVPSSKQEEKNVKDEYIWINENWELIGSTKIDLSNYYTKDLANTTFALKTELTWDSITNKPTWIGSTKPTYTASEVGLGNVGNFKAVSTVANQGLSELEKSNARANIGIDYTGLEDIYSYGVEWDSTVSDPTLTRIGNPLLHKSLPIQSQYKGCVANGGVVNYYLNPNDWSKKVDGSPSVLDGTDGTVRVHIPKFYGKSGVEGTKRWVRVSTIKMDDTWTEIPEMLVDAYRSTVDTTTSATPKAVSVVNTTAEFRGGGNRTANDTYLDTDAFRSDLGKPRTNISRANMRTYATNAGSEMLCYEYYKWIFYWAWVIEYATFNSQARYYANLTSDGYHQGGLGDGVTTWDSTNWNNYNGYYPLTPCGYCNDIGNFTGVKDLVIPETVVDGYTTVATKTFKVPRWRGFDNPFGDIWTNLDGIILERTAANEASSVYTTTDPTAFGDDNTAKGKMTVAGTLVASDGYTKAFDLGEKGEIIPSAVGGSNTTYMCDYHYCNASSTALRTLFVGGGADSGGTAGLSYFNSNAGVSRASTAVGFRTLNKVV